MADVVATSEVFAPVLANEVWPVTSEVAKGTALISGAIPGVAYTNSGGHTFSKTYGDYTISGPDGGASLDALEVTVAIDGTWMFPVTGVTGATAQNTLVYAVVNTGKITSLTLTSAGNTLYGKVNLPEGFVPSATATPVKVGV